MGLNTGNLRVFEAFAGYGSQAMALRNLKAKHPEFDYEVVGISEIDKYALRAYEAVHGHCPNFGDICSIDWESVPDFDLFTYSSPCQDFSSIGLQKGGEEGSGTRSSLLWECRRAIAAKKPKYLLLENVKALTSRKFMPLLQKWIDELAEMGYRNYWRVLNAKDYGVPQNRERVFVVSILGDDEFEFPEPDKETVYLKSVLESEVDAKYFLSEKMFKIVARDNKGFRGSKPTDGGYCQNFDGYICQDSKRRNFHQRLTTKVTQWTTRKIV